MTAQDKFREGYTIEELTEGVPPFDAEAWRNKPDLFESDADLDAFLSSIGDGR